MSSTGIYLVIGSAGEYDAYYEWVVGWSSSEDIAEAHAGALSKASVDSSYEVRYVEQLGDLPNVEGVVDVDKAVKT